MARARAREAANVAHARTVREHAELVAAIEARDVDRARAVLASHLVRATNLEERLGSMGIPGIPSRAPDRVGQRRARAGGSATRRRA